MCADILCSVSTPGFSIWLWWALVGLIGGYMAGRFKGAGGLFTLVAVVAGMAGAVAGGWLLVHLCGADDKMAYMSLITAAAGCGVVLWILNLCRRD